jgi:hydroxymethylpyrimidine/phosphomethylpyrimidine kinase
MENNTPLTKAVLTIAGSDPSGGAGIQADLKTFTAIGVYSGAVITCNTVQNTMGVTAFQPLDHNLIKEQIAAVVTDLPISHVKIGMIGTMEIAAAIYDGLADFQGELVWDPVMHASSGMPLTNVSTPWFTSSSLFHKTTVLTPNLPELELLTGLTIHNPEDIRTAAGRILQRHENLRAVLVKGGHQKNAAGLITDYLFLRSDVEGRPADPALPSACKSHERIQTVNDHGTGCTFASAFTAFHLLTDDYIEAFTRTTAFMQNLITLSKPFKIGHGRGPLLHHLAKS